MVDVSRCPHPSICGSTDLSGGNLGLAFGLSVGAGLATGVGAAVPFLPCLTRERVKFLSVALGASSGVMIYISLVEMLQEASNYMCCVTPKHHSLAGVGIFFLGGLGTFFIHSLTHKLAGQGFFKVETWRALFRKGFKTRLPPVNTTSISSAIVYPPPMTPRTLQQEVDAMRDEEIEMTTVNATAGTPMPTGDETTQEGASKRVTVDTAMDVESGRSRTGVASTPVQRNIAVSAGAGITSETGDAASGRRAGAGAGVSVEAPSEGEAVEGSSMLHGPSHDHVEAERQRLLRMGVVTAGAIFVHNLPEGLVSFVGALANPKLGVALAIAVALHNIPEGIAASVPLYFATGNRWKAFMWGMFSGLAEPFGALLGWVALSKIMGPAVYGTIFGLVAGIMVYIVVREALPTAHRYDPDDHYTTLSFFFGMVIMAASLLLFEY